MMKLFKQSIYKMYCTASIFPNLIKEKTCSILLPFFKNFNKCYKCSLPTKGYNTDVIYGNNGRALHALLINSRI